LLFYFAQKILGPNIASILYLGLSPVTSLG